MWGAVIGDIVGSIYEWDNVKTKDFGPLFRLQSTFTDDTVCTIAVADILLNEKAPASTMRVWCRRYPEAGYGSSFKDWISDENMGPYNSWGNGSAMRISPAALIAVSREQMLENARQVTIITHDHPEGIKGAMATVDAIHALQNGASPAEVRSFIELEYDYPLNRTVDMIRPDYDFDVSCQGSVPEAIICALEADSFEDTIRNAISLGGDSDTIACIAGAIAEARFGAPQDLITEARSRLTEDMRLVMAKLYDRAPCPASLNDLL